MITITSITELPRPHGVTRTRCKGKSARKAKQLAAELQRNAAIQRAGVRGG